MLLGPNLGQFSADGNKRCNKRCSEANIPVVLFAIAGFKPFPDAVRKVRGNGWTSGEGCPFPLVFAPPRTLLRFRLWKINILDEPPFTARDIPQIGMRLGMS